MKSDLRSLLFRTAALLLVVSAGFLIAPYTPFSELVMAQTTDARKMEAARLLKQGNDQLTANQPEAALQTLRSTLKLYRDLKNRAAEGQTLKSIGNAYQSLKQYDQAIAYQQQALEIAREIKDRNLEARALNNIGLVYEKLEKPVEAIEYYKQSLAVSQSSQNLEMENKTLANLGLLYRNSRKFDIADAYFKERLALTQRSQNNADQADVLDDMCINDWERGSFENSIQVCRQALTLYQVLKNQEREKSMLVFLALAYQSLGKYEGAIDYFQRLLLLSQKTDDLVGQARSLTAMAGDYGQIGENSKAIDSVRQGLAIARRINRPDLEKSSLSFLIGFLSQLGEYAGSVEYAKQYLEISKRTNDFPGQIAAIRPLVLIYGALGDEKKLFEYAQNLKIITKEVSFSETSADALLLLGQIYNFLANIKVEKALDKTYKLIESGRPVRESFNDLSDYSKIYASTEIRQAIEYLNRSLAVVQKTIHNASSIDPPQSLKRLEVLTLSELQKSYSYLKDPKATNYAKQALQVVQQDSRLRDYETFALLWLGTIYFRNSDLVQAIKFYRQGLVTAQRDKKLQNEGFILHFLGEALYSSGKLAEAEKVLFEAARISESIRKNLGLKDELKISSFEGQQSIYRTLEEVLIAQDKPESALEISERGRARTFIEQLKRQQAELPDVTFPSVEEIKQTAKQHNATLAVYSVGIDPLPTTLRTNRQLFIWIVQPTGKIEFRTVDLSLQQSSLVALVNLTRQAIGARGRRATLIVKSSPDAERISRNQQTQQLQQLHKLLIDPIASLLPTDPNQRVIFIPQGELFLVPFPALQDAKGTALIEQHTILTAPSIQVLDLTRQAAAQKSRGSGSQQQAALVVGNPTMPKVRTQVGGDLEQLSNLAGAETEADAIATLLKTKPIIGKQATKAAIVKQMMNARMIHLATHGLLDDFKGLGVPGAIALAPDGTGKDNDGLLTADEILDLKLNADLVVLSACDTGRGRITGDGVIGLSRSLITAGVPSIIVSLWKVPDASTAFLMTEFYRNLQQQPDKAQALRQAMQATKKKYPDPLDWAAFTLIGESE